MKHTKCIVFSKNKRDWTNVLPITLNLDALPWVDKVKHLGNMLQRDNSMSTDVLQKRGKYIGKVNSLLQEFHFVKADILTKLVNTYATSFYGSCLWNLGSAECQKLYASWNVSIRMIFNLDRCTHRYLIESVSQCLHPKVMLESRFVTFFRSLVNSNKFNVRFLARLCQDDQRTVMGRTLRSLVRQCSTTGVECLTATLVKRKCCYFSPPESQEWRGPLLRELIKIRDGQLEAQNLDMEETNLMIDHLCLS